MSNLDNATFNLISIKDTEVSNNIVETFNRKDKRFYFNIEYINNDLIESTDSNSNNDLFIRSVNNNIALITNNDKKINIYGPTVFKNDLTANREVRFNNNFFINGTTESFGAFNLNSSTNCNSSLTCNGTTLINGLLNVKKSAYFFNRVELNNDVYISKQLNITGHHN